MQFDAIIAVDTAKKELLGDWINSFEQELNAIPFINIDHHPDNTKFGTINYIQNQPSASAVIYNLIRQLNIEVTPDIATNLLAGLLSDTAGFANSNSDAKSLRIAAELVDRGANLHQLMVSLFRTMSLPAIKLWGVVLSNIRREEPGIIITQLTQGEIADAGASDADVSTLGTLVNNILVAEHTSQVAVMLKDKGQGEVSGSMRAIADVDVSAMARQLGGGGHIKAAGFRLKETTIEQARQTILETIRQSLSGGQASDEQASEQ
jgi:phosphoesterase RecJ-like protein